MGRSRRLLLALAVELSAVAGGASSSRGAETKPTVLEVGWWTRLPTESAPEHGFAVGSAPDGPTTVAAIRLDLGDTGVTSAVIDAAEAGGTLQALAGLRVCAAVTPWKAVAGGSLADAPAADCSNQAVRLTPTGNGVWRADIAPFTAGRTGVISIAVVPEPDSAVAASLPSAYDVQFDAPRLTASAAPAAVPASEPAPPDLAPAPAPAIEPISPGFFAPLAPPAPNGAVEAPGAEPQLDTRLPRATALPSSDGGPSSWRWQVWVQITLLAALVGVAAGGLRWGALRIETARAARQTPG